jgi:predicted nucleic acid-binding protein
MEAPVVCDTDALIDYFVGAGPLAPAVRKLLEKGSLAVTTVTLFELACGAGTADEQADIRRLSGVARTLDLTPAAAWQAAQVWRQLREAGQSLNIPDVLVAGCCLAEGLALLTRDSEHFGRIPGLTLAPP